MACVNPVQPADQLRRVTFPNIPCFARIVKSIYYHLIKRRIITIAIFALDRPTRKVISTNAVVYTTALITKF